MKTAQVIGEPADMSDKETPHELIGSDRVEGTRVFRPNGQHIGHIERIMLDKRSGQAAYAVMSFGGFLGVGQESYPLPWSLLKFNAKLGGYEVNVTDEQLKDAPKLMRDQNIDMGERVDASFYAYYGVAPYWF